MNIISLGAGVQSTTMALMAAHGEITPMPDCAIFADTQWEPDDVYRHLDWLMSPNVLPFPIHVVSKGDLKEKILQNGYSDVPFYTKGGIGRRQCTKAFKLYPLRDKTKELMGVSHGRELKPSSVIMWVGISTDEASRMKPSTVKYIENRWPLIEHGMKRWDCYQWLERNGYPVVRPHEVNPDRPAWPPRSACKGCPFRSNEEWRILTKEEFEETALVDDVIRNTSKVKQFMHRSLKPLRDVDLSTDEDRGQINMFNEECEGMCGV